MRADRAGRGEAGCRPAPPRGPEDAGAVSRSNGPFEMTILNFRFAEMTVVKRRVDGGFLRRPWGSPYASQDGYLLPLRPHSSPRCLPAPPSGTHRSYPAAKGRRSLATPTEAMTFVYTTNLSEVRVLAETQARRAGLAEDRIADFVIAVSEIAANTVRHARTQGSIEIWLDAGEIICEMHDGGVIADPASAGRQPPAADASGGHGPWLARQSCDKGELHSDSDGPTIRLHMSLPPPGPQARDSPDPNGATSTPDVA